MQLSGLAPGSIHPAHIHLGDCKNSGKALYTLENVIANKSGEGTSVTQIPNVVQGIPANGWSVNVHSGPNMAKASQLAPLACADILNPGSQAEKAQNIQLPIVETAAAGASAKGSALLVLSGNQLTVTVTMQGLVPNTTHAIRISNGSCASQGRALYTLYPVKANAAGEGSSTSVFPNIPSIPHTGWYVDVRSTGDSNTQLPGAPIACGDVSVAGG
jgi:hypothetical protein